MKRSVWIGWEPRETAAFAVAAHSLRKRTMHTAINKNIRGVVLPDLQKSGLYKRPHSRRLGPDGVNWILWDEISEAPMATEFACSRFLVPTLARRESHPGWGVRWALFTDCDMMFLDDVNRLFDAADPTKAVMVVKHNHKPKDGSIKMDGQVQTRYNRKNWSSVCLFNIDHPANVQKLTVDLINSTPGRDLHAFCWLEDDEIGELDPRWNYLVGHTKGVKNPGIVHHTDGIPQMHGYEDCEFADEWRAELNEWAAMREG